jgi:hypothetical protein
MMMRAVAVAICVLDLTGCGKALPAKSVPYPAAIHAPRVERACEQTQAELKNVAERTLFARGSVQEEKRIEKYGLPNEQHRFIATIAGGGAVLEKGILTMEHMALAQGEQAATKIVLPRLKEHRRGLETVGLELKAHPVIKGNYATTWSPRIFEFLRGCKGEPGEPPFPGAG